MAEDTSKANDANASDNEPVADGSVEKREESKEIGGRKGPDPTRYGDWAKEGRCIDF